MQRQAFYGNVQVPREAYPYLLTYLDQRFGRVQRVSNSFVDTSGKRVATILNPDSMMMLGQGIFQAERISISSVVNVLKAKGRPRLVRTSLAFCGRCQAFYATRFPETEHEVNGERHNLAQLLSLTFPTLVKERRSILLSKGWINPQVLARVVAARQDALTAPLLAKFRCDAFAAGVRLTVQELLDYTSAKGAVIDEEELVGRFLKGVDYERYVARPEVAGAGRKKRGGRRRTYFATRIAELSPTSTGKAAPASGEHRYGWQAGTMLEWKLKVNGKVLSREQKLAAMMQLGLLTEDTFQQAVNHISEDVERLEDEGTPRRDEEEQLRQKYLRSTKKGWKPERISEKKERSPRDSRAPTSVRLAEVVPNPQQLELQSESSKPTVVEPPEERTPRPPVPQTRKDPAPSRSKEVRQQPQPPSETPEQLNEEREKFLKLFNISPEEIVYERGTAIKAEKVVDSENDACRLQIFNSTFYPQRIPLDGEFRPELMQLAGRVAGEFQGSVVVTEDRKNGFVSLAVAIAGAYTVRVVSRRSQ